jgi:DeoR/GlpR family transcriptional regulator of sugar metabolism
MIPEERRRLIARHVREAGSVTVALLEAEFGISPMTARRDLAALEEEGRVRRTHGGAVLPEYAGHEDSFWYRLEEAVEAKERLAGAAVGLLEPGTSVFLDCSTTAYYLARRILITDPDLLEAGVKRAMIEHSEEPVLLVDGSKFEKHGLNVITHASKLSRVLVADAPGERLEELALAGVEVERV